MRVNIILFLVSWVLIVSPLQIGFADSAGWRTLGVRAGFSDTRNDEDFNQYEGYAIYGLPWILNLDGGWHVGTYLEMNAGLLEGGGDTGLIVSVGPGLCLISPHKRLLIGAGFNPTYVSEDKYGREDIGGPVQFTTYIGLTWKFYRGFSADYRLQHMSNAGIYSENPGINQHMFSIGFHWD